MMEQQEREQLERRPPTETRRSKAADMLPAIYHFFQFYAQKQQQHSQSTTDVDDSSAMISPSSATKIVSVLQQEFPHLQQQQSNNSQQSSEAPALQVSFLKYPKLLQHLSDFRQQNPSSLETTTALSLPVDGNNAASTVTAATVTDPSSSEDSNDELEQTKRKLQQANQEIFLLKRKHSADSYQSGNKKLKKLKRNSHDSKNSSSSSTTSISTSPQLPVSFEKRLQELQHYHKGYGHCRVPAGWSENPGLARWVQTIRQQYKERNKIVLEGEDENKKYIGSLTDERVAQLNAINFEWTIYTPKQSWEKRFQDLLKFKQENGHVNVKRSYSSLGEWCHRQRFLAHKGQLEPEKIQQLESIGFVIRMRDTPTTWDDHFEMLLEFRRKHGHLNVPPPDQQSKIPKLRKRKSAASAEGATAAGKAGENNNVNGGDNNEGSTNANPSLGEPMRQDAFSSLSDQYKEEQAFRRWVVTQRDNYHLKFRKGLNSTLNKARVKKLSGIGFDFTRKEGNSEDLRKVKRGALHHRNDPEVWNRRFQELVQYKERYQDTNVPKEWKENKPLGAWVATQRKMYKAMLKGERSSLTAERQQALESLGFVWVVRPSRTKLLTTSTTTTNNPAATMITPGMNSGVHVGRNHTNTENSGQASAPIDATHQIVQGVPPRGLIAGQHSQQQTNATLPVPATYQKALDVAHTMASFEQPNLTAVSVPAVTTYQSTGKNTALSAQNGLQFSPVAGTALEGHHNRKSALTLNVATEPTTAGVAAAAAIRNNRATNRLPSFVPGGIKTIAETAAGNGNQQTKQQQTLLLPSPAETAKDGQHQVHFV